MLLNCSPMKWAQFCLQLMKNPLFLNIYFIVYNSPIIYLPQHLCSSGLGQGQLFKSTMALLLHFRSLRYLQFVALCGNN